MPFDPNNNIVKLCAEGMHLEGEGKKEEALTLFQKAWNEASDDFEKFTAAHYVARHQASITDKLQWDEAALSFALKINDGSVNETYPSLYLNIAKCYEDLKQADKATKYYQLALSYAGALPDDGYGNMIKQGINNGLKRVTA